MTKDEAGVTVSVPLVGRLPDQPPLAVQLVALVLDQVRTAEAPGATSGADDVSVTVGAEGGVGGSEPPPPPPPQAVTNTARTPPSARFMQGASIRAAAQGAPGRARRAARAAARRPPALCQPLSFAVTTLPFSTGRRRPGS
ncbi:MAG: hypothetical protein R3E69_06040 [Steroidobacteraceae bacterium]